MQLVDEIDLFDGVDVQIVCELELVDVVVDVVIVVVEFVDIFLYVVLFDLVCDFLIDWYGVGCDCIVQCVIFVLGFDWLFDVVLGKYVFVGIGDYIGFECDQ